MAPKQLVRLLLISGNLQGFGKFDLVLLRPDHFSYSSGPSPGKQGAGCQGQRYSADDRPQGASVLRRRLVCLSVRIALFVHDQSVNVAAKWLIDQCQARRSHCTRTPEEDG
jgi:hypothetical protein